jgi:hypothetical protein
MTDAKAKAKAARLTASGVPTRVVKDSRRPAGHATANVATRRVNETRASIRYEQSRKGKRTRQQYEQSAEGKAKRQQYAQSVEGKASKFRWLSRLKVSAADLAALRAQQEDRCPLTNQPLADIPTANDHAHDDVAAGAGCLRGVIHRAWNSVLGRTDEELFQFARRLQAYAMKRSGVLVRRGCRPMSKPKRAFLRSLRNAMIEVARKALAS